MVKREKPVLNHVYFDYKLLRFLLIDAFKIHLKNEIHQFYNKRKQAINIIDKRNQVSYYDHRTFQIILVSINKLKILSIKPFQLVLLHAFIKMGYYEFHHNIPYKEMLNHSYNNRLLRHLDYNFHKVEAKTLNFEVKFTLNEASFRESNSNSITLLERT